MDRLEYLRDLLKCCFLPELKQDFDSIPLEKDHFAHYHEALRLQLPLLYDFLQQHEDVVFPNSRIDGEVEELQASLVVLLCEITGPGAVYKVEAPELIQHAHRLLQQHSHLPPTVEQNIFKYYQRTLHKDCWKRQLGAVHGFLSYLENRYKADRMTSSFLTFCLSVGLIVRSCAEPKFKQMSTRIFQTMLSHASHDDVQVMNIHSVIYDAVFKDVHLMDSEEVVLDTWNCLCKCLDYYPDIDSFSWNCVDDMLESLIRNISLAPNAPVSICLLKFVVKLTVYFTINRSEFEEQLDTDLAQKESLNICRLLSASNTAYTNYRWAKSILNIFIIESYKLMQSPDICRRLLIEMHRCYIFCILPIALEVIEPHLITFFDKFTIVLMELANVQKQQADIIKLISDFLETFYLHLKNSTASASSKLAKYRDAYKQLLQHAPFTVECQ